MKNVLTYPSLVLLTLLDACASHPQQQPADPTTAAAAATDASASNGWQTLRVNYTARVQRQADSGVSSIMQTKDVVVSALDACKGTLRTIHDGSRDHLSAPMLSSDTHKTADRVTKDIREKAHVYPMGYVDHVRCLAKSR